jgi:hypothetical protein
MSFIPRYTGNVPYLGSRIRHLEAQFLNHHGKPFNYSRVWWTPPLEPKAAFDLERTQIENTLGLNALVSLSDHDSVDAGFALEMFSECAGAPISTEWTVPIEDSFLHIGVHNLHPARARLLESAMAAVTANPSFDEVHAMLDELNRDPSTLIILNHPLWDESRMGQSNHERMLNEFLNRHGEFIHALELNGLRCHKENANVERLAAERNFPVISGGDRHGCEPNALVNLTNAATFNQFAAEVRDGAPTHTLYLKQYEEPIRLRVLQVMSDVLRTYDDFETGRQRWSDRIFYLDEDETVYRLSDVWKGSGPGIIGQFVQAMRLMELSQVRAVLRVALGTKQNAGSVLY